MSLLRLAFAILTLATFISCNNLQKKTHFDLQKGDLIFQDLDSDSISDAIESVTGGKEQLNFSHIGIVDLNEKGEVFVLEAISKGVTYTAIDSFLNRNTDALGNPKVAVGRLKSEYSNKIQSALDYGKSLIGAPYDNVYIIGDSNYYCSELIYEMFVNTSDSSEVFLLKPMTFKAPESDEFLPFWIDYYQQLGVDIPEGKPGLNPNGMFQSSNIDIVLPYGSFNSYLGNNQIVDSLWFEFASAMENKNLAYLIKRSLDTIQCVDCTTKFKTKNNYYDAKMIFKNHLEELMHLDSLTNKDFSSYSNDSIIRIGYTIECKEAPEGAYGLFFSFRRVKRDYLFSGMFTVP